MDAKSLYSAQHTSLASAVTAATSARDAAVIATIQGRWKQQSGALEIAELSIGDGTLSFALAAALPTAGLTFVDISRPHLDAVRRRLPNRGTFVELDLDRDCAELGSAAFDAVIALDVLEHLFDVFAFVGHCRRVLRPGGTLILRVPNIAYVKHRIALLRGRLPVTSSWFGPAGELAAWRDTYGWDGSHLHYFTLDALRALFADAGLRVLSVTDPGARFARVRRHMPGLLCGNLFVVATPG